MSRYKKTMAEAYKEVQEIAPAIAGLARVNSFVTKSSGTWGGADKDLAAKVRGRKK